MHNANTINPNTITMHTKAGGSIEIENILYDVFQMYSVSIKGEENHMDMSSWRHFYRQIGLVDDRMTSEKLDAVFDGYFSNHLGNSRQVCSLK